MATQSSGLALITSVNLFTTETTASSQIGQKVYTQDGRAFHYTKNGGVAGVVGELQQTAAEDTAFQEMATQANTAIGATAIPVTLGATATTANQFNGGILVVSSGTGLGQGGTIISHTVAAGGATATFTISDALVVAITAASSKVTVQKNPYDSVIKVPATTQTGAPVGGLINAPALSTFFWMQTGGMGYARADGTATSAAAMSLSPSVTTAGDVTKQVTLSTVVGKSMTAVTISAKHLPLIWSLDA